MSNNSSTSLSPLQPICPELHVNNEWTLTNPVLFFTVYSLVAGLALFGNTVLLTAIHKWPDVIQRRTYRLLSQLMCTCELIVACDLVALLFRMAIGYRNRTTGSRLVSSGWTGEDENAFDNRGLTVRSVILSIRDVAIGSEVFLYCLLALDRVLAISHPLSKRWSPKLVSGVAGTGFAVVVTVELSLKTWLYVALASVTNERAVCDLFVHHYMVSMVTKSGAMVCFYLVSLVVYITTGCMLVSMSWRNRAKVSHAGDGGSNAQHAMAMRKPLAALILGNVLHFISILPLVLHGIGFVSVDWLVFYAFFANCAVVPSLAIAFNSGLRSKVARLLGCSG